MTASYGLCHNLMQDKLAVTHWLIRTFIPAMTAASWSATMDQVNLLSMLDAYGDSAVLLKLNISQICC